MDGGQVAEEGVGTRYVLHIVSVCPQYSVVIITMTS